MDLNFELYKMFRIAAKAGSISAAAKEMYISQPAVSQAIHQLEEKLETKLFVRNSRGITLTPEGETLFSYIDSACALIEAGQRKIESLKILEAGELNIGAGDSICNFFLSDVLGKYHGMFPKITIHVTNRTSSESLELLRSGKVDLAFVNMPCQQDGLLVEECVTVHDCFVCGERYKYLYNKTISWRELGQLPLLMLERLSNSRRYVEAFAASQGVKLEPQIELGSFDVLAEFARNGLGVSCTVREFARAALEKGEIREVLVDPPVPARAIGMATAASLAPSAAAAEFIQLLRETVGAKR